MPVKYVSYKDIKVEVLDYNYNPLFFTEVNKVYHAYRQCYSTTAMAPITVTSDECKLLREEYKTYLTDILFHSKLPIDFSNYREDDPIQVFKTCDSQDDIGKVFMLYWSKLETDFNFEQALRVDLDQGFDDISPEYPAMLYKYLAMCKFISKFNMHQSPLEHATLTVRVSNIDRACSHQVVRHRIASYSQASQRYIDMSNPPIVIPDTIRNNLEAKSIYMGYLEEVADVYKQLVDLGIPKEDARYILPNATTTELVMTMNWREWMHFCSERCCSRAQTGIRTIAKKVADILRVVPYIFTTLGPKCFKLGYCPEHKCCGVSKPKSIQIS